MPDTETKMAALRQAAETAPEYAAITPLFLALYRYLQGREGETGINVDLGAVNRAERTGSGFPLITPAEISIDRETLIDFLIGAVAVLSEHGSEGEVALVRIAGALASGMLAPEPLLLAVLERRRAPLDEAACALRVPSPLVQYLFEIALRAALERCAAGITADAFPQWRENVCPVCGARPAMAELVGEEGRRRLFCSTCSYTWPFQRLQCPSCGCDDSDQLSYFTAGEGATRVDTCRACSRYIKTRDARKGGGEVPLEVEDLLTIHLDLLAAREGFERGR